MIDLEIIPSLPRSRDRGLEQFEDLIRIGLKLGLTEAVAIIRDHLVLPVESGYSVWHLVIVLAAEDEQARRRDLAPDAEAPWCPFCFQPIKDAVALEAWRQLQESKRLRELSPACVRKRQTRIC